MATTFLVPLNNAESRLDGAVVIADLTWTVLSGAAFPGAYPFHVTCENEIASVTNKVGNDLTVTRAQEGTAAADHATETPVQLRVTAKAISDLNTAVNALEAAPPAHKDSHDPEDGGDPLDTANAAEIAGVQAAGTGSSHSLARADHAHQIQHSIANNHLVTIDHAAVADNDYAKFTADGLEGRSYAETLADISPLTTRGDIMFRNATISTRLAAGAEGEVLTMGADDPTWAAAAGGTLDAAYDAGATITVDDAGTDLIFDLTEAADFLIKDNGAEFFKFSDAGALTHTAPAQLATSLTLTQAGNYTTNADLTLMAVDRTAVIAAGGNNRIYTAFNIPTFSITHPINATGNRVLNAMYFRPILDNDFSGGDVMNMYASYVFGMDFLAINQGDNAQTSSFISGRYARGILAEGRIDTCAITGGDTKNNFVAYGVEAIGTALVTETAGTIQLLEAYGVKATALGDTTGAGNVSKAWGVHAVASGADYNYGGHFEAAEYIFEFAGAAYEAAGAHGETAAGRYKVSTADGDRYAYLYSD